MSTYEQAVKLLNSYTRYVLKYERALEGGWDEDEREEVRTLQDASEKELLAFLSNNLDKRADAMNAYLKAVCQSCEGLGRDCVEKICQSCNGTGKGV